MSNIKLTGENKAFISIIGGIFVALYLGNVFFPNLSGLPMIVYLGVGFGIFSSIIFKLLGGK